jgi:hypothetical protein
MGCATFWAFFSQTHLVTLQHILSHPVKIKIDLFSAFLGRIVLGLNTYVRIGSNLQENLLFSQTKRLQTNTRIAKAMPKLLHMNMTHLYTIRVTQF